MGEVKKRIEYIDLMKGICITLVVLVHCDVVFTGEYEFCNNYIKVFRMPLYIFLSGLFFKASIGGGNFLIKKINNLIIPYLFFSLIIIPLHYFLPEHYDVDMNDWKYYLFCFIEPFNVVLWFLRSLFIVNIIYFFLSKGIKNITKRILVCFLLSILTWLITPFFRANENIILQWFLFNENIFSSLFALPYIAIADWCKNKGILTCQISLKKKCLFLIISALLLMMFAIPGFDLRTAIFPDNLLYLYISSFAGIFMVMMIARIFNKVFYLSYIGRYSLIVLGVHMIIKHETIINLHSDPWITAIINLACAPIYIYILKKFFPYFTAQKPLLEYVNGRIVLPWNKKHDVISSQHTK